MPDEVTLDVTTIEENVTVETTAGDVVEIQVVAPTGPTGATGPAGPNSVTSATTSDGTGQIMLDTLAVGTCNILDEVVFDTLTYTFAEGSAQALKDALSISFADVSDAQTGTATLTLANAVLGNALIVGNGDTAKGRYDLFGNTSHLQWYSDSALYGERSFTITTENLTSSGEYVYKYPVGNGTLTLTGNTSGEPDKLTSGTISGATTFNATSYTYGTGAAAAHRTALGVGTRISALASNTNVTSSTTLQSVASLSVVAGKSYAVYAQIAITGTANTGTRHGITFPASTFIRMTRKRASSYIPTEFSADLNLGIAETTTLAELVGFITVTVSGTVNLLFAQNTSHPDTTTCRTFTYLTLTELN